MSVLVLHTPAHNYEKKQQILQKMTETKAKDAVMNAVNTIRDNYLLAKANCVSCV